VTPVPPLRPKLALVVAVLAQLGCSSSAPPNAEPATKKAPTTPPPSAAVSAAPQAIASAAAVPPRTDPAPAVSASPPAASTAAIPARPADVVRCEAHPNAVFGTWTPTVDEVVAAIAAIPQKTCLALATRQAAVRSCAAEAKTPLVVVSTDDLKRPAGCEIQVGAAEANGRKWISFFAFYRSPGARFDGGARVVELTSAGPKLYLDALDKHGSLCPTTGGAPLKPRELPEGWTSLPQVLKDFLCAASK
jgi:hypothetical protein